MHERGELFVEARHLAGTAGTMNIWRLTHQLPPTCSPHARSPQDPFASRPVRLTTCSPHASSPLRLTPVRLTSPVRLTTRSPHDTCSPQDLFASRPVRLTKPVRLTTCSPHDPFASRHVRLTPGSPHRRPVSPHGPFASRLGHNLGAPPERKKRKAKQAPRKQDQEEAA